MRGTSAFQREVTQAIGAHTKKKVDGQAQSHRGILRSRVHKYREETFVLHAVYKSVLLIFF